MSLDRVYVNARYSLQHNSKVGRQSFNNFRLPQANCDKHFLKFHFLNESMYSSLIPYLYSFTFGINFDSIYFDSIFIII